MPFERFTDRARKVLDFAVKESSRLECESVDTVHLLLGLLREGNGVAANVLSSLGISADRVLTSYERHRNESDVSLGEFESRCQFQTEWLHHNYAGTEHLILALCSFGECRAVKVMADIGVTPHDVAREVLAMLGHEERLEKWVADQPG